MNVARELIAVARLIAKKGEVPEAFKKQWKNKDKDGDGKENEPKPDFLKKKDKKAKKGEVPEAFKKQWNKGKGDKKDDAKDDDKKGKFPQFLKDKGKKKAAEEKFNVMGKRDGKMGKWNKKPLSKGDAEDLMAQIEKAKIPSVDTRSLDMVLASVKEIEAAATFKCPECGSKVLENTGYCLKCKKKVKKARSWEPMRKDISLSTRNKDIHQSLSSFAPRISASMKKRASGALLEYGYDVSPRALKREWSTYLTQVNVEKNTNKYHYYVSYSFEDDTGEILFVGWNCSGRIGIIERAYDLTTKYGSGPTTSLRGAIWACENHLKIKERNGYDRIKMVRG